MKQTVVFLLMILTYSAMIDLPWGVYMTFVLEERHGFNKQVSWRWYTCIIVTSLENVLFFLADTMVFHQRSSKELFAAVCTGSPDHWWPDLCDQVGRSLFLHLCLALRAIGISGK